MMSGKSQQKLLTEFLNLPGVLVKAYRAYEGIGFILQLEAVQQQASCPSCGLKSEKLHQNHWYLVKDLPISSQPVYLRVNRRQLKCMQCRKPFSEELSYVSKNRTYTKRLAKEIVQQVLDNTGRFRQPEVIGNCRIADSRGYQKSPKQLGTRDSLPNRGGEHRLVESL